MNGSHPTNLTFRWDWLLLCAIALVAIAGVSLYSHSQYRYARKVQDEMEEGVREVERIQQEAREKAQRLRDKVGEELAKVGLTARYHNWADWDLPPYTIYGRPNATDESLMHLKGMDIHSLSLDGTLVSNAGLKHIEDLKSLRQLRIDERSRSSSPRITDDGLQHLAGLVNLNELELQGTSVTGIGLEYLKKLTVLRKLVLHGTRITDAGSECLGNLASLHELDLNSTQVTDAGLQHLNNLNNLQSLNLSGTKVTGEGLKHLRGITSLRTLNIGLTDVTDAEMPVLAHLPNLTNLNLGGVWMGRGGTRITDTGLKHFKGLISLRTLNLHGTEVTDAGLAHLIGLTNLQVLLLNETRVSATGVEMLQRALPDCQVLH